MSQHLECRLKPQVLNRLVLGKLRRFVMKHVLPRQSKAREIRLTGFFLFYFSFLLSVTPSELRLA
ncbi:hypothetical protein B9Z43_04440 [Limnohabitans sp. MMS-10A-192]|nr:hypothetical protein B9Z43_04440 [Limnohabitans sp. MMS-10A-192]